MQYFCSIAVSEWIFFFSISIHFSLHLFHFISLANFLKFLTIIAHHINIHSHIAFIYIISQKKTTVSWLKSNESLNDFIFLIILKWLIARQNLLIYIQKNNICCYIMCLLLAPFSNRHTQKKKYRFSSFNVTLPCNRSFIE